MRTLCLSFSGLPATIAFFVVVVAAVSVHDVAAFNWLPWKSQDATSEASDSSSNKKDNGYLGLPEFEPNYKRDYYTINEMLIEQVNNPNPEENLMAAIHMLRVAAGEAKPGPNTYPKKIHVSLVPALLQFTSLMKFLAGREPRCDLIEYDALLTNVNAAKSDIMLPDSQIGSLRRIDLIIRSVALVHAGQCRMQYPKLFKKVRANAGTRLSAYIALETLMKSIIERSTKRTFWHYDEHQPDKYTIITEQAKTIADLRGVEQAKAIFSYMLRYGEEDPDYMYLNKLNDPHNGQRWIVVKPKIKEVFERLIGSKCEYLEHAAAHVLQPAEFDQQLYEDAFKYRSLSSDYGELMVWLQYYRLCKRMNDEDHDAIVKNIVKLISAFDKGENRL